MRRILLFVCLLSACLARPQMSADQPFTLVPPKRWAIVIGAGKYETLGELRYAPADARDFAKSLVDDYKFKPESVTKLIDEPNELPPTVANIRAKLDETLKDPRLNKGDLFIFYFSGHGVGTPKGDFLCPIDARKDNIGEVGLPVKEVLQRIVKAGLRNVLIITDACRGGEKNTFGDELNKLGGEANVGVMLGCQPGRRSYQNARGGHGYFTESLLEALKKPELRQPDTGAVWASELGKWVSQDVEQATGRKEDIPQVPTIECDDRRDVMVGAFIPSDFDEKTVEALKAVREGLQQDRQAAALADYASRIYDLDRFEQAAELLRVADSLVKLEDSDRLLFGSSLLLSGRANEASAQLQRVAKSETAYFAQLATLIDPVIRDNALKVKAAERVFEELPTASMAWKLSTLIGNPGDGPQRTALLKRFLQEATGLKGRTKRYLEAEIAFDKGDFENAEKIFREALKTFGLDIPPNTIRWRLVTVLLSQQKFAEIVKLGDDAIAENDHDLVAWYCSRAIMRRGNLDDKDGASQDVQAALKHPLTADRLLVCVRAAGSSAKEFADRLIECGEKNPRSVNALVLGFVGKGLKDGHIPFQLPTDHPAFRYSEDRSTVVFTYERATTAIWEDLVAANALDEATYGEMLNARASALLSEISAAGDNEEYWFTANAACLKARRAPQLLAYYRVNWTKRLADGTMSAEMQTNYMLAALAAGEFDTFDAIYKKRTSLGGDALDLPWYNAMSQIVRGQDEAASKLIVTLGSPSPAYRDIASALRIFAKAALATPKEALAILEKAPKAELVVSNVILGMAWLKIGHIEKAGPLLESAGIPDNWAFQHIDAAALGRLAIALRKAGDHARADDVAFLVQYVFPWMPIVRDVHFGEKEGLELYAGEYSFSGAKVTDARTIEPCEAKFEISKLGELTGIVSGIPIKGKVDGRGNVTGVGTVEGKPWAITMKLAPKSYYSTFEQLKAGNQTMILQSREGPRLGFQLKPTG